MQTTFRPELKTTETFIDEHGMTMSQNYNWKPDGDNGEGDSIGRTLHAYIAWRYPEAIEAVKKCFRYETDNKGRLYIQGYRHPNRIGDGYNDMSRDHITNMLVFMKLVDDPFLDELIDGLRWKISDRYTFTPDLWLWMKALKGSRWRRFIWYCVAIPIQFFQMLWNKYVWKKGGFEPELTQEKFEPTKPENLTKNELKWRARIYPYYALLIFGLQLYVMPNTLGKRISQKICLWGTPNQNFVMKLLFGGKVTQEEVNNYKPMKGGRWSGILNKINDRDLRIITDPVLTEANLLDVDFLKTIYNQLK